MRKVHYGWVVFAGCCVYSLCGLGLTSNIFGVFMVQAAAGVNAGIGTWAMSFTLGSVVSICVTPFWGRAFHKWSINSCLIISSSLIVLRMFGLGLANELWQVFAVVMFTGLAGPVIYKMIIPILLGNWFDDSIRGRYLSLATIFSGLGALIWAPIFALIIQAVGYRVAYFVDGALIFAALFPFGAFLFKYKPADKGLEPIGYDPHKAYDNPKEHGNESLEKGTKAKTALKTPAFWLIFVCVTFASVGAAFNDNMTSIAIEFFGPEYGASQAALIGSTLISTIAAGNVTAKLAYGFVQDRFGYKLALRSFIILFGLSFLSWLIFGTLPAMYVGAFLLGTHSALVSVGLPLCVRKIFGNKEYAQIWAYLIMLGPALSNLLTSVIAWIYEFAGSNWYAMWFGVAAVLAILICSTFAIRYIDKVKWDA